MGAQVETDGCCRSTPRASWIEGIAKPASGVGLQQHGGLQSSHGYCKEPVDQGIQGLRGWSQGTCVTLGARETLSPGSRGPGAAAVRGARAPAAGPGSRCASGGPGLLRSVTGSSAPLCGSGCPPAESSPGAWVASGAGGGSLVYPRNRIRVPRGREPGEVTRPGPWCLHAVQVPLFLGYKVQGYNVSSAGIPGPGEHRFP